MAHKSAASYVPQIYSGRESNEVLTQETRRRIAQVWGERLYNQYATTEGASLAAECNHHQGMHLAEDLTLKERRCQRKSHKIRFESSALPQLSITWVSGRESKIEGDTCVG